MRVLALFFLTLSAVFSKEITLQEAVGLALENSPLVRSAQRDLRAQELELRAARGALFPRIKLEETFTRTDIPAYAFMNRLNQERVAQQDFDPTRLNNPPAINNFETRLTLEVPIWLGGRLQSAQRMAEHEYRAVGLETGRRKEEVIRQVYHAYMDAVLAKEGVKVSRQAVEDAKEHLRLAERMHAVGMALLSDVLRARVYLSKAEENLEKAVRGYQVAKRGLEVAVGMPLGEFEVQDHGTCPTVNPQPLRERVWNRRDIKALEERLKTLEEAYRFTLSDNLPQVYAFAQYFLNSRDYPFGADGRGYLVGLGFSWSFDTGLATLRRAQANLERKASMQERLRLLKDSAVFEFERSYAEYENSMRMLTSAEERMGASQEVLRVMQVRYRNGLARMVDVLDAQTELDRARLEKAQAINACHRAYMDLLFNAGLSEEVRR